VRSGETLRFRPSALSLQARRTHAATPSGLARASAHLKRLVTPRKHARVRHRRGRLRLVPLPSFRRMEVSPARPRLYRHGRAPSVRATVPPPLLDACSRLDRPVRGSPRCWVTWVGAAGASADPPSLGRCCCCRVFARAGWSACAALTGRDTEAVRHTQSPPSETVPGLLVAGGPMRSVRESAEFAGYKPFPSFAVDPSARSGPTRDLSERLATTLGGKGRLVAGYRELVSVEAARPARALRDRI
jgi:hypothetical protein